MTKREFAKDVMFSYGYGRKRFFAISMITLAVVFVAFVFYYVFALKNTDYFFVRGINFVLGHIGSNIKNTTELGLIYSSFFGGLFFILMSLETVFIAFLKSGFNPIIIIPIHLAGMVAAYTANYFMGFKLAKVSKKMISPKKFYKIKGFLNKHGGWAIFIFNILPLPSQPLSAILGVFRYSKARFYIFFISGQLIKYVAITLSYIYILS